MYIWERKRERNYYHIDLIWYVAELKHESNWREIRECSAQFVRSEGPGISGCEVVVSYWRLIEASFCDVTAIV